MIQPMAVSTKISKSGGRGNTLKKFRNGYTARLTSESNSIGSRATIRAVARCTTRNGDSRTNVLF